MATYLQALGLAWLSAQPAPDATPILPPPAQIESALRAAPEDRRAGAAVLGYEANGRLTTLREGSNELICLADDPKTAGFSAACYHKDLEPFMARGRELAATGLQGRARNETRWKEVEAGTLRMPREPRTLYVLTGKSVDPSTGQVAEPFLRWVIYVPFATAASTGLPTRPVENGPWLMDPGTAGAHIMITPAKAAPAPKPPPAP